MSDDTKYLKPLTSREILRRESLAPEAQPPDRLTLAMSTLQLPEGAEAALVKVEGASDTYQVQVTIRGDLIGRRTLLPNIPTERLSERILKAADLSVVLDGLRPPHLPIVFAPPEIKQRRGELAQPPFDFDYISKGMPVDRPTNVFAPDERYIYNDTAFPWCTVGRVDTPLGRCTGCTIGSRLLLTANHCIQWNADGTAGWVRFRPAYYNGSTPFGEAWATRVIHWTRATPADGLTDQETAFDYVVCVLDTRMGDVVGYPGYRTYDDDWNGGDYWQHMGYPVDLSGTERPAFQGNAVIASVSDESASGQSGFVLGHFNDVVPGHSGGPVWGWWSSEPWPRVVGTQSAEASVPANNTSGDNEFGGGPALSALISWARSNYP